MDSLKVWLIEVVWKQMGPSLIKGALAAMIGLIAANHGLLALIGLTYDPTQNTLNLDLDTFGKYALMLGTGGITAIFTLLQHHTTAAVVGKPQSGDMRASATTPVVGGNRIADPRP